jgi:hypothetical protein
MGSPTVRAPIQFGQLRTSQSSPTPTPRKTGSASLLATNDLRQGLVEAEVDKMVSLITQTGTFSPPLGPFARIVAILYKIMDQYNSPFLQRRDSHQASSPTQQIFPSTPSSLCHYIFNHSRELDQEMETAIVSLSKEQIARGMAFLHVLAEMIGAHNINGTCALHAPGECVVFKVAKVRIEKYHAVFSLENSNLSSFPQLGEGPGFAKHSTDDGVKPNAHPSRASPTSTDQDLPRHTPDAELQRTRSAEEEVERLKRELAYATQTIANQEVELEQNRLANLTMEHVVGSPCNFEPRAPAHSNPGKLPIGVDPFARRPMTNRMDSFPEDGHFEYGESSASGAVAGAQDIWGTGLKPGLGLDLGVPLPPPQLSTQGRQTSGVGQMNAAWNPPARSPSAPNSIVGMMGNLALSTDVRSFHTFVDPQALPDPAIRGMIDMSRPGSALSSESRWYTTGVVLGDPGSRPDSPNKLHGQYQGISNSFHAAPIDLRFSRLNDSRSPRLVENGFDGFSHPGSFQGAWNTTATMSTSSQNYVSPNEPMNYRRLLDRNMSCDWTFVVDKIVRNNDQQASIFLQQKLKLGTQEQKYEIVQSIIAQAYSLMTNRFGNFLVQRCFEHGSPNQIEAIAKAICGNTLNLSMDPFGCHVVQKALDCVPEGYKAIMVHELLRRIPDTVIHRYACHVWQKLFELRWSDSPPQIMKYVNEALRGMWHEVALGETGSLVVQNIFENCLEEDKRPCINEVLSSIDIIAHGQFGNWCIQHICEHGTPGDRNRAIDHILRFATEYSTDQYASKVIEKCLKIGGNEFLDKYLDRVCQSRADRPRIPLIDIAGDQFGNYLIQWILTNASAPHREIVAAHIRKHMVSLRGSKYGSRVAMLCSNPANQIRPGPPTGLIHRGYSSSSAGRGGHYPNSFR